MEGLPVHSPRGIWIAPSHGASKGSSTSAPVPPGVETAYPTKDQGVRSASHTEPPDDTLLAAALCSGKRMTGALCAPTRLKTVLIYFLNARWFRLSRMRQLLGGSTSRQGTHFGNRSAKGLSGGIQSGRPSSPHYGRYGSTETKLYLGVNPPPPMRYSMLGGGSQDPGTSVARPIRG